MTGTEIDNLIIKWLSIGGIGGILLASLFWGAAWLDMRHSRNQENQRRRSLIAEVAPYGEVEG